MSSNNAGNVGVSECDPEQGIVETTLLPEHYDDLLVTRAKRRLGHTSRLEVPSRLPMIDTARAAAANPVDSLPETTSQNCLQQGHAAHSTASSSKLGVPASDGPSRDSSSPRSSSSIKGSSSNVVMEAIADQWCSRMRQIVHDVMHDAIVMWGFSLEKGIGELRLLLVDTSLLDDGRAHNTPESSTAPGYLQSTTRQGRPATRLRPPKPRAKVAKRQGSDEADGQGAGIQPNVPGSPPLADVADRLEEKLLDVAAALGERSEGLRSYLSGKSESSIARCGNYGSRAPSSAREGLPFRKMDQQSASSIADRDLEQRQAAGIGHMLAPRAVRCNSGRSEQPSVASLMLDVADKVLQDGGLLGSPSASGHSSNQSDKSPKSQASSEAPEARLNVNRLEEKSGGGSRLSSVIPEAKVLGKADSAETAAERACASNKQFAASDSTVVPRAIWNTPADQAVARLDAGPQHSSHQQLVSDCYLSKFMSVCGILPWWRVDLNRRLWRNSAIWYQWLIVLLVFGACGICWLLLWMEWRNRADCESHGCEHTGLLVDIPLATGAWLGLLAVCAQSGSHQLDACMQILRCYASREGFYTPWMKRTLSELCCSTFVWCIAVVVRFAAEGLTWHAGACVVCTTMLMSLKFCMVYFCHGLAAMVDQYCILVCDGPVTEQLAVDWHMVDSVVKRASDACGRCVFVLVVVCFAAVVLGVTEFVHGTHTASPQYASFASWALVTLDIFGIIFRAAAVTERCTRVPVLIQSCSRECNQLKHYMVEYIKNCCTCVHVLDVRLDASLAFRSVYLACVVAFAMATRRTVDL